MRVCNLFMICAVCMLLHNLPAQDLSTLLAGKKSGTIELKAGTYQAGNAVVPSGVTLKIPRGAVLNIPHKQTLTINGSLDAGIYKIFAGAGKVTGQLSNNYVYPQWFGAVGDGRTECGTAFQNAADLAQSAQGKTLFIPLGRYLYSSGIVLRCNVESRGVLVRRIKVDPKSGRDVSNIWLPSFKIKDVLLEIANDTEGDYVDSSYFTGIKSNDLSVKNYKDIPLQFKKGKKVDLLEGGTLIFISTDYFISRNNLKGDEYYTPNDICKLVSAQGAVFPEFCFDYNSPSDAPPWDPQKVYRKGEYVKVNGKIYKSTFISGPGTSYTHKHLGKVNIGAVSPAACTRQGFQLVKKYKYSNGKADSLALWVELKTSVRYIPPQTPLTINNLVVEVEDGLNDKIYRCINTAGIVKCSRSNVTFNRLDISVKSPYLMLRQLMNISYNVDVTLNHCNFSGATYHGLGYNIYQLNTANLVLNHCTSTNSRNGFAGRHGKNVTINGGYFNRIDDHYGRSYKINNVDFQCVSTHVPWYTTPKCDLSRWSFVPATPLSFAGGDLTIENCRFHNPPNLLDVRCDTGDMFGTVAIRNCTVFSDKDVDIYIQKQPVSARDFDFTRNLKTPNQLLIENMTMQGNGRFSLAIEQPHERCRIMLRNIQPLGVVNVDNADLRVINSTLKNLQVKSGGGLDLFLSGNIFDGNASELPPPVNCHGSGNFLSSGAAVPFVFNQ